MRRLMLKALYRKGFSWTRFCGHWSQHNRVESQASNVEISGVYPQLLFLQAFFLGVKRFSAFSDSDLPLCAIIYCANGQSRGTLGEKSGRTEFISTQEDTV